MTQNHNLQGQGSLKMEADAQAILVSNLLGEVRRLKRFIFYFSTMCLVGALTTVALLLPQKRAIGGSSQRVVEATSFVLKDNNERIRAVLDMSAGVGLTLKDVNGKNRAGLSVSGENAYLFINNEDGVQRILLGLTGEAASLHLNDPKGKEQAAFMVNKKGPTILLRDAKGLARVTLNSRDLGPSMVLRDAENRPRMGILVDDQKGVLFNLLNEAGKSVFQKPD